MPHPKILYVSFDQVPAPKGASTHILAFVEALGKRYSGDDGSGDASERNAPQRNVPKGNVVLATPAADDVLVRQLLPGVRQLQLGCSDDNPLGRVKIFQKKLCQLLEDQPFDLIHFRSIYEGVVVCDSKMNRGAKLIYEANGFPSLELKYHYPEVRSDIGLTEKLAKQEVRCLAAADQIITIADVSKQFIESRMSQEKPIRVIRNGYDPNDFVGRQPQPTERGPIRIAYVGTLSHWQGIETLLEAVELVNKERRCLLTICCAASQRRKKAIAKILKRLNLEEFVNLQVAYSKSQVCGLLHQSHMTVVPLLNVDRNSVQGCCPIKMIEGMASGCPVIASNLPVVQELGEPDVDYLAAKPGDARNLKNLILKLATEPKLALTLSQNARRRASENLTWRHATDQLLEVYNDVLGEQWLT